MQHQFYNYKNTKVDLLSYCIEQRARYGDNLVVLVGTDSISLSGQIYYFMVVAFRHGANGVHFIYAKDKVATYRFGNGKPDIDTKLRREGHLTFDLVKWLVEEKNLFRKEQVVVEFDFNESIPTLSHKIVPEFKGLAAWYGYQSLTKYGESVLVEIGGNVVELSEQIAVKAANHLCQRISG